jgi:hypothetical protein
MAVTCAESYNGRNVITGTNRQATIKYVILGTDSDSDALTSLESTAPETWSIDSFDVPLQHCEVDQVHETIWIGTAFYSFHSQQSSESESIFQFDTGGGSQHITQAINHINSYAPSGLTAPDFKGAVGVAEKTVEGVDIIIPVYNFSEVHYLSNTTVNDAYKATLFSLTGKVNSATYKGYLAGELLFKGASGSKKGRSDWEMTFNFAASPNKTDIVVGDISGIAKKGWEYLWVQYEDDEDTTAHALVKRPKAVFIEQVYDYANLSGLSI